MNKGQAQKEYLKLLDHKIQEKDKIKKEAIKNGTWKSGLDSNNDLFIEVDNEFKRKIELLKSMIDD